MYLYKQWITRSMIFIPAISLFLNLFSPATTILSFFVVAFWALAGRQQAIQALFMSWLLVDLNPGLNAMQLSVNASGRYLVILAAIVSVFLHFNVKMKYFVWLSLLLGIFFIIHSLFVSPFPDVSILKSAIFISTFITLLSAWSSLNLFQRTQAEVFIFGGMIVVVLISFAFFVAGIDIGYLRNGTGFQGILNHPQTFGPFIALTLAWIIGRFLSTVDKKYSYLTLIYLCAYLIIASESRTAAGAIFLGVFFSLATILLILRMNVVRVIPRISTNFFKVIFFITSALIIGFISLSSFFTDFIIKKTNHDYEGLVTELKEGRIGQGRIELAKEMTTNIRKTPLSGIGFGIGSSPREMKIVRDPYFDLPISAPIEKGIMPLAILEEVGILGAILVFSWVAIMFRRAWQSGPTQFIVISTAFMVNLGQNIFFSTGGLGLLVILLVTWSIAPRPLNKNISKQKNIG